MMVTKTCDSCSRDYEGPGKVYRLNTGGNSGVYLCRSCWAKEMAWRKDKNAWLKKGGNLTPNSRFPVYKFPKYVRRKK